uniref:Uncharacterized protein n=1 Tax=Rhizophora mucronata TaxID=61149 RepID=A0A2P2Q1T3_RHIMU
MNSAVLSVSQILLIKIKGTDFNVGHRKHFSFSWSRGGEQGARV